jgi:Inhibitor of growth proteins N-terminal histone-binding
MAYRGASSSTAQDAPEVTHIEEFLDSIASLPNEVKRNLLLIRTLDKSAKELLVELAAAESEYLAVSVCLF